MPDEQTRCCNHRENPGIIKRTHRTKAVKAVDNFERRRAIASGIPRLAVGRPLTGSIHHRRQAPTAE
jgi:hypothetical protein